MSTSRGPARPPRPASAKGGFTATVDLLTPPLQDATATTAPTRARADGTPPCGAWQLDEPWQFDVGQNIRASGREVREPGIGTHNPRVLPIRCTVSTGEIDDRKSSHNLPERLPLPQP